MLIFFTVGSFISNFIVFINIQLCLTQIWVYLLYYEAGCEFHFIIFYKVTIYYCDVLLH